MQHVKHFEVTRRQQRRFQWLSALALAALTLTTSLALAQTPDAGLPGKGIKVQALQSPIAEETFQTMLVDRALEKLGYEPQPIKEVDYPTAHIAIANGDATYLAVHWTRCTRIITTTRAARRSCCAPASTPVRPRRAT
jgi:glycine betaine/proline transport system substrate-binding protein